MTTHDFEEIDAPRFDVPHQAYARLHPKHDAREPSLAFLQRRAAQVGVIEPEEIERHEVRPVAAEEQIVEVTTAVLLEADDLAIEHR